MVEGVNVDFLSIVIEAFLLEMPSRLDSLRSVLARGDAAAVRAQAQSMKSGGVFIGIGRFAGLCRELEALALTGDTAGAGGLVSEIEAEYARVEQDLWRRLGR
ncbi:MAG: Hpt domain-containing protein [Peptococcaceae bacterium]|nr:Hpt domain-containing protein [Peptococcaceae bacterium]